LFCSLVAVGFPTLILPPSIVLGNEKQKKNQKISFFQDFRAEKERDKTKTLEKDEWGIWRTVPGWGITVGDQTRRRNVILAGVWLVLMRAGSHPSVSLSRTGEWGGESLVWLVCSR
jgi:hypothetical protein